MGLFDVLGVLAGVALGIAAIALTVHLVNKATIQKKLREEGLKYAIVKNIQKGNVNKVNVGLFDSSNTEVKTVDYSADEIGSDIRKGMKIYA